MEFTALNPKHSLADGGSSILTICKGVRNVTYREGWITRKYPPLGTNPPPLD